MMMKCLKDPRLNSPMGSWLPFCRHLAWFTASDSIKWWFPTFWGLRKTTTFTSTKWVFLFIIKLLEGRIPPLQNEFWFLHAFFYHQVAWREHPGATKWILVFTCLYMFFLWCLWRETRHPYRMSWGHDWSFSMSPPRAAHHAPHLFSLTHQPRSLRP